MNPELLRRAYQLYSAIVFQSKDDFTATYRKCVAADLRRTRRGTRVKSARASIARLAVNAQSTIQADAHN